MQSQPTGADTEEWVDIVDPSTLEVSGQLTRHQAHTEGHWHQVFHCLVVRKSTGSVLLQERSPNKSAFPDLLDFSVTGHLSSGESVADGVREIAEELGIEVSPDDLVPLGTRLLADDSGEGINREIVHVHLLADDRPLTDYSPAPEEVSALFEVQVNALLTVLADQTQEISGTRIDAITGGRTSVKIRQSSLVEGADGYWTVMIVMAQRFLAGHRPIAI